MAKTVLDLQNVFTVDQYPKNENNRSEVPIEDIYGFLNQEFPGGYEIRLVSAGGSGSEYFAAIEIHLQLEKATLIVPGAASGGLGLAGCLTMAIKNACLRHIGMGTDLYKDDPDHPAVFENSPSAGIPGSPFSTADQHQNFASPPNQTATAVPYASNGGARAYGPWTGEVTIKTGNLQGMKWNQLEVGMLQGMASKGNNLAQKELARRAGASV